MNQRDDVDVAIVVVVNAVLPKLICDFVDADNVVVNDVVVSWCNMLLVLLDLVGMCVYKIRNITFFLFFF